MTILKTFSDTVKQYPSKVAVMYSGGEFTFQEVDVMSNFIAKQFIKFFDVLISDRDVKLENHSVTLLLLPKKLESYSEYQEVATTKENEIAHIICTSGTTGVPKKVFLTDDNIDWLVKEFYKIVKFTSESKFLFTTGKTYLFFSI